MSAESDSDEEFRDFMRGQWPALVRLARGLTGDQGHAEDLAQAAFSKHFAFVIGRQPRKGDRWTAYDAAGKPVASGPVSVS